MRIPNPPNVLLDILWIPLLVLASPSGWSQGTVTLREEPLVLPVYEVAPPGVNPRFYSGRVYQGARASFYPYPVQDRLTDKRTTRTYTAVTLENRYLRLEVLPELGGRIFTAVDKTHDYDFFYRQHVIKPALIGMLGAWISGGVEWNVPHHHRATSFLPVDHVLEEGADGSRTVWVGETEWRHRMRWMVGITLRPGRSFIEMQVRISNPTPVAHSFLFWINPAVHANPDYQVLFPPRTEFGVQHGKPEFARWPVADGRYAGTDYAGVDISWWKNHPEPVSFFAWHSDEDFFGGYDHGREAGVLHVANHHLVPGKKFFEWGNGPRGEMWTKILTETDGPYLELMAGAFSDNQPDYSWLQPGEVKTFRHFWYPVRKLGGVKSATVDGALNLEVKEGVARVILNTTAEHRNAELILEAEGALLLRRLVTIGPGDPFTVETALSADVEEHQLRITLRTPEGRELVAYRPEAPRDPSPMPEPVDRPRPPADIESQEELYLTGLRVEQLYSPAADPEPYYEEALRRDPGDYRAGTALGILRIKHGRFEEAEEVLRAAVARVTENYIRPRNCEALYYLGVALRAQGRDEEARDAFWRSVWSQAWKAAGYQALAELACRRGEEEKALELVRRSLTAGGSNTSALNLETALLRKAGRRLEALSLIRKTLSIDPLCFRAGQELLLLDADTGDMGGSAEPSFRPWKRHWQAGDTLEAVLDRLLRRDPQAILEMAVEYGSCGFFEEAVAVLRRVVNTGEDGGPVHPMLAYYLGFYLGKLGKEAEAERCFRLAARLPPDYCFPFRFESVEVLEEARRRNPRDARASCYLGNLLYDHQPERAIRAWETSLEVDDSFYLPHRNLGLGYAQARGDIERAIARMEKAVALRPRDPRLLYELDRLYEEGNAPLEKRLESLTRKPEVLKIRDDAFTRAIMVRIRLGQLDEAVSMLESRRFHNWEGRGEIHGIYTDARLQRGRKLLREGRPAEALSDLEAALEYPENLEVGRPRRNRRGAEVWYWIARGRQALGDEPGARQALEQSVAWSDSATPEASYAAGLALRELGRADEADRVFAGLVERGRRELEATSSVDYFDKFGEKSSERSRKARAHYLLGLGYRGQGQDAEARAEFEKALELDRSHLGARTELRAAESAAGDS